MNASSATDEKPASDQPTSSPDSNSSDSNSGPHHGAAAAAPPRLMFAFTLFWTTLLGAMLHFGNPETDTFDKSQWLLLGSIVVLYPVFLFEIAAVIRSGDQYGNRFLRYLIPPLRLGARDTKTWTLLWLPWLGYRVVNRNLRERVERAFAQPMLIVTLLVLPLLVVDFLAFKGYIERTSTFRFLSAIGETIIWVAFTVEFVVMCSLSKKKINYCKENWIDLVVILLPLFAFLRFLRLSRLSRLTRFTRAVNVYRFRGATVRLRRGIMVLEMVNRFLRPQSEKRLLKLQDEYEEKREELENLEAEIQALKHALAMAKIEEEKEALELATDEAAPNSGSQPATSQDHSGAVSNPSAT